jgi:hypothetical protein
MKPVVASGGCAELGGATVFRSASPNVLPGTGLAGKVRDGDTR